MKKIFYLALLLNMFFVDQALAQLPNIDRTCKNCERRYLDSLNVYNRRPIRLNQSGFRPQDYKYAYVADTKEKTFKVIDANSGKEVPGGGNLTLIGDYTKPGIWITGAFNSMQNAYTFGDSTESTKKETLYRADFSTLSTIGEYFLVVGNDTSATFHVHPSIYNAILENSLQFFGIQRCGNTDSHFHKACHLKDGSAIGHDLTGGWHDCGDHFKVSETLGYAAYVLSMVYLTYPDKAEDRYGHSYADTVFTDGIPDILYEAKIGADFILKLYKASKADGLLKQNDMYHSVGVDEKDHQFWDVPEKQDAQPESKGGPDRVVLKGIGANTAGMFVAALANVATGYRVYDPAYSDTLLEAASDIYKNVLMPLFDYGGGNEIGKTTSFPGFYTGGGPRYDDGAAAALAMWYATKDTMYRYDLYKNKNIFDNETNYHFNMDYFKAGFLGNESGFTPGGWATDYQNIHSYVLFAFQNLILNSAEKSKEYGLTEEERDTLSMRNMATFRKLINDATNEGDSLVLENPATSTEPHEGSTKLHVIKPYNLVWTSFDWGVIRYNLGTAVSVFLMYELTKDERYLKVALDNMYYALGANPWDISLLMGAGDKNPQHPHNRSANPDGYNAGGMPYQYRCPIGALMGGRDPNKTLIEDWSKYTSTETCIDFSAQFLFPAQSLAETLPPDNEGPIFSNIAGTPISDTEAIISWDANEVSLVTVFYDLTTNVNTAKSKQQEKASKGGSITLTDLTPGATYYFFLEGMDTKRNITTDDNHGYWYKFTMTPAGTTISGVTICQVDNRSAKIYWWSSDRMNGVVNYGKTMGKYTESTAANGGTVLFHEALLTGLEAGTDYYFSVSSGTTTDDNGGAGYHFKTDSYATYADIDVFMKPLNKNGCTNSSDWKQCNTFLVILTNNDTMAYNDMDLKLYLPVSASGLSYNGSIWDGTGQAISYSSPVKTIGPAEAYSVTNAKGENESGYVLPIHLEGEIPVSGSYFFELILDPTYGSLEGAWTLKPHVDPNDPEQFKGIDLTKGPLYKEESNSLMYIETINGVKEIAFTRTPYITAHYHGRYIYGYGPDYTPENGPQTKRTVTLDFETPFVSPYYSIEKVEPQTSYTGKSHVSPTGILDDFELNGTSIIDHTIFEEGNRKDSFVFGLDTTLAYGNNYIEWVSWHNHNANKKTENPYDCACAVVRSNVEIDSITKPLEKRYLTFDRTEITGYKNKMIEITISVLDSSLELYTEEPVNVDLVNNAASVKFWTDPTATIPVTTITLYKGTATLWVSSDTAVTTTISATAPKTADYVYEPAVAKLDITDLPPWPIIDVAKIVDLDCDHIPDAMDITLSSEYLENQSFKSISFTFEGETYVSNVVKSQNGRSLIVAIDVPKTINTSASGKISLTSDIMGKTQTDDDSYSDGISPALLSASVLERVDSATSDHLYLQFSEPISAPGLTFPLTLYQNDQNTVAAEPTVISAKLYSDSLNLWDFEIAFNNGQSTVKAGMFGQLSPTSTLTDLNGNGIGSCPQEKREILLKILPVPMTYASISDNDQDGYAEHIDVLFERELDELHKPDELKVIFGYAQPETLMVKKELYTVASGNSKQLSITLKTPFKFGNTAGTFSGTVNGKLLENAGQITQQLGTGAATVTNSVLAEDKVGPVFVTASLSKSATADILTITASEPLSITDSALTYFRHKRASNASDFHSTDFDIWDLTRQNTSLSFAFRDNLIGNVMEGDFVRMGSLTESTFMDANGNIPANEVPWITVDGSGAPKIRFTLTLNDDIVTTGSSNRTAIDAKETMRFYVMNPTTNSLDRIVDGKIAASGIDQASISGAVWSLNMQVPRGGSYNEPCAWSNLHVDVDIPVYSNLGNFVNRLHNSLDVDPDKYLSSTNQIQFYIEWANKAPSGLRSKEDRAVGTGAYIYKAEINTKFTPNMNKSEVANDSKIMKNFSSGDSYEQTRTFGIKRDR